MQLFVLHLGLGVIQIYLENRDRHANMNLFENHRQQITASEATLADRLRPRHLDEFIGQEYILGQGRLLGI